MCSCPSGYIASTEHQARTALQVMLARMHVCMILVTSQASVLALAYHTLDIAVAYTGCRQHVCGAVGLDIYNQPV